MSAAHAFVDDLDAPALSDDDRRHLTRVLRVREGEAVTVSDGRGGLRRCRLGADGALAADGDVQRSPAPAPAITVVLALPKGDRPEWAVQKLTEVGVDRIVVLHTARSVVRWDDAHDTDAGRTARRLDRLRRVAREAAMQSRRVWLPAVDGPVAFTDAVAWAGACLADHAGPATPALSRPAVLVGPEGGWADEERAAAAAAGVPRVTLGPQLLRVETAAVAAGVLLTALRAGVVSARGE